MASATAKVQEPQAGALSDVAEVAASVMQTFPMQTLQESSERFDYAFESSPDDRQTWKAFRTRGYMTAEELGALSRWKTGGRQTGNVRKNTDDAVRAVSRAAIDIAAEVADEPALPLGILTVLHGVDLPTASTIMTVWNPERFGILDIRAWNVLRIAAPHAFVSVQSLAGNRRLFRLREAELYLRVIRLVASGSSLTCREVDRALWVLGGRV